MADSSSAAARGAVARSGLRPGPPLPNPLPPEGRRGDVGGAGPFCTLRIARKVGRGRAPRSPVFPSPPLGEERVRRGGGAFSESGCRSPPASPPRRHGRTCCGHPRGRARASSFPSDAGRSLRSLGYAPFGARRGRAVRACGPALFMADSSFVAGQGLPGPWCGARRGVCASGSRHERQEHTGRDRW